jgi:hypothetical protein
MRRDREIIVARLSIRLHESGYRDGPHLYTAAGILPPVALS